MVSAGGHIRCLFQPLDPRFRGDDEGAVPGDVEGWTRALACFRRAEAAVRALEGGPDEAAFDRALTRFNAALRRLLRTPAPDLAALAAKIAAAVDHETRELAFAPLCFAGLRHDADRLARSS